MDVIEISPMLFPNVRKAREFLAWLTQTTGIDVAQAGRDMPMVRAKRATWLILRYWGLSTVNIGRLTKYHHSTVLHGIERGKREREAMLLADTWLEEFEAFRLTSAPSQQQPLLQESTRRT